MAITDWSKPMFGDLTQFLDAMQTDRDGTYVGFKPEVLAGFNWKDPNSTISVGGKTFKNPYLYGSAENGYAGMNGLQDTEGWKTYGSGANEYKAYADGQQGAQAGVIGMLGPDSVEGTPYYAAQSGNRLIGAIKDKDPELWKVLEPYAKAYGSWTPEEGYTIPENIYKEATAGLNRWTTKGDWKGPASILAMIAGAAGGQIFGLGGTLADGASAFPSAAGDGFYNWGDIVSGGGGGGGGGGLFDSIKNLFNAPTPGANVDTQFLTETVLPSLQSQGLSESAISQILQTNYGLTGPAASEISALMAAGMPIGEIGGAIGNTFNSLGEVFGGAAGIGGGGGGAAAGGSNLLDYLKAAGSGGSALGSLGSALTQYALGSTALKSGANVNAQPFTPYNVVTPYGTGAFSGNTAIGTLAPEYQKIRDQAIGQAQGVGDYLKGMSVGDISKNYYDKLEALSKPYEDQNQAAFMDDLYAKGIMGAGNAQGENSLMKAYLNSRNERGAQRELTAMTTAPQIYGQWQQNQGNATNMASGLDSLVMQNLNLGGALGSRQALQNNFGTSLNYNNQLLKNDQQNALVAPAIGALGQGVGNLITKYSPYLWS